MTALTIAGTDPIGFILMIIDTCIHYEIVSKGSKV